MIPLFDAPAGLQEGSEQSNMTIKAFNNRLATLGFVLYLVIATILLRQVGAANSCQAEIDACNLDTECLECLTHQEREGQYEEYLECTTSFDYEETDTCSIVSITPCCLDLTNSNDCVGNNNFVEYFSCILDQPGLGGGGDCTLTCIDVVDGGSDGASGGSDGPSDWSDLTSGVGSSSPIAMLMFFLALLLGRFYHIILS